MEEDNPLERIRQVLDELTATSIVAHVVPYYHGWQVEGEWLDALKGAIADELDELDRRLREGRAG